MKESGKVGQEDPQRGGLQVVVQRLVPGSTGDTVRDRLRQVPGGLAAWPHRGVGADGVVLVQVMFPQPGGKRDSVIRQFGEVVRTGLAGELHVNNAQLQARVVVSDRV